MVGLPVVHEDRRDPPRDARAPPARAVALRDVAVPPRGLAADADAVSRGGAGACVFWGEEDSGGGRGDGVFPDWGCGGGGVCGGEGWNLRAWCGLEA